MAYYRPSIDAEGVHIPTYDDILSHLIEEYKSVFGDDIYLGVDSKDYQMLSIFAKSLDDFCALSVDAYNSRSPIYATGDSLDVLCTVVGLTRKSAENAVVTLKLTGTDNTVISEGSKVVDFNGELWSTDSEVTISSGEATVTATKDVAGEVKLTADYITTIYTPIVGWTGVENTSTGTTGKDTESDEDLRVRMTQKLITKATFNEISIENEIRNLDEVTDCVVYANNTNSTDDRGITAHSICAVVKGGDNQEIADTVFGMKAPGIGTYGTTSETVVDTYGNSNTVYFSRPNTKAITVTIAGTVYDARSDLTAMKNSIKEAVMNYINGLAIGESFTVNQLYAVIYSLNTVVGLAMTSLYVTYGGTDYTTVLLANWNDEIRVTSDTDIDVSGIVYNS